MNARTVIVLDELRRQGVTDAVCNTVATCVNAHDSLVAALEDFVDAIHVPERNCSCHISPPCDDCVDNGRNRELVANAHAALAKARAA